MFDIDVVNYPNLPKGPKIFVANHPSTTDPFLMTTFTNERTNILIHNTLFEIPVFGFYLRHSGHLRVDHKGDTIKQAQEKLNKGESIIIFIEGGISPLEGGFLHPHTGPARLAISHCVPIIPVGLSLNRNRIKLIQTKIKGRNEVGTWYFRGPYAATIGRPIYFIGNGEDREYVRSVTDKVMNKVIELSTKSDRRLIKPKSIMLNGII